MDLAKEKPWSLAVRRGFRGQKQVDKICHKLRQLINGRAFNRIVAGIFKYFKFFGRELVMVGSKGGGFFTNFRSYILKFQDSNNP